MKQPVLFVSSNNTWGGSEILWSEAALYMIDEGYTVRFAVKYEVPLIQTLVGKGATYINLNARSRERSLAGKVVQKVKNRLKPQKEIFYKELVREKPGLVIISQGNNVDGSYYMSMCRELSIPYVTITQLVTNILWTFIQDEKINELRLNYAQSRMNYFVSQANLELHNTMIGEQLPNSKIVLNPFAVPYDVTHTYPSFSSGYRVALVGRVELFHKGHDLLLSVLAQPKWRSRPVTFSLYGTGPHTELLQRLIEQSGLKNVVVQGYTNTVADVWKDNHLLILPSRMEGQALALIEAMWCCRGAVVTDVGGARELVTEEETGFIAPYPAAEDLDKAMEKAWLFRDAWEEIGQNAGRKIRALYREHPVKMFVEEIKKELHKV